MMQIVLAPPWVHTVGVAWFRGSKAHRPIDILVVCTGNVCRSPYLATLLGAGLPELTIVSAGIRAVVDETPGAHVARALAERGVQVKVGPPQNVSTAMVRSARLIITATALHRVQVVALDPTAAARAFTLKELARVHRAPCPGQGLEAVAGRAAQVARTPDRFDYDDDLADPYGLGWPAFDRMATEVDAALTVLIPALRQVPRRQPAA